MKTGVVVPTKDRRQNLEWLLASLGRQTLREFTVVVADDGSSDGTREVVERQASDPFWDGRLRWVGCGPRGGRRARARNIGMSNLPADTTFVVMLDSDLILQSSAIEQFVELHALHRDAVLLGPVDRLPHMDAADVRSYLATGDLEGLRERVPNQYSASVPQASDPVNPQMGPDYRPAMFNAESDQPVAMIPYGPVNNNAGWPLAAVWSLGGLDERMDGWGHADLEFGTRAANAGLRCVFRPELWALHVWHPHPAGSGYEWQRNLDYYIRRHGVDMEPLSDWTLWFHYHVERGGTVARSRGKLWAFSRSGQDRIYLPDPSWLKKLGHCGHRIPAATDADLAKATDRGRAVDRSMLQQAHSSVSGPEGGRKLPDDVRARPP